MIFNCLGQQAQGLLLLHTILPHKKKEKRIISYLFSNLCLQGRHVSGSGIPVSSVGRFDALSLLLLFVPVILCTELIRNGSIDLLEQRTRLRDKLHVISLELFFT